MMQNDHRVVRMGVLTLLYSNNLDQPLLPGSICSGSMPVECLDSFKCIIGSVSYSSDEKRSHLRSYIWDHENTKMACVFVINNETSTSRRREEKNAR